MTEVVLGKKRKGPPAFQHLPEKRAKKLKKEWLEREKIKAQWRKQKRAEQQLNPNLVDPTAKSEDEDEDRSSAEKLRRSDSNEDFENSQELSLPDSTHANRSTRRSQDSGDRKPIPWSKRLEEQKQAQASSSNSTKEQDDTDEPAVSLRELSRKAYSPASLHQNKSDPLRRRKGTHPQNRQHSQSRDHAETNSKSNQRRGQPNMKLRMDAMLAKIKRDFT